MKIRTDFVTNSSSSSFVSIHVENPILVRLLANYQEELEDYGFVFSGDLDGNPTTFDLEDGEDVFQIDEISHADELATNLLSWLDECFLDGEISQEDYKEIKKRKDEILSAYVSAEIESSDSGWDESSDTVIETIQDSVKRWGFEQMDATDPRLDQEVQKWKLILMYEYEYNGMIDLNIADIRGAIISGDPYQMAHSWSQGYSFSCGKGGTNVVFKKEQAKRSGPEYEEYLKLKK